VSFSPNVPSAARIYDYLLGGKDNYPADRKVGEAFIAELPNVRVAVQWNRAFLRRAVRYMVGEVGITQIIDVGAGLPTVGPTHEVATEVNQNARVVYVDRDPVVLAHGRDMLQGLPDVTIIQQDMFEPAEILADPDLLSLIDFSQPVGLMYLSVLHFAPDSVDPAGIIARMLSGFPDGSHVAISHLTSDSGPSVAVTQREMENTPERVWPRTRAEILDLVAGLDLVEPGLAWIPRWRPDPGEVMPENVAEAYYYAMVARKP
jgi:S-adenosyl methyltransferase